MISGERQVGRGVQVLLVKAEDQRHLHREVETLKQEWASTTIRIKGLLRRSMVTQGVPR